MGDIIYKEVIFMELLEYIRKNYKTPNVAVLRTLGASEELIKYLINTPNNTNMKVVESFISEGGDEGNGVKSVSISPAITTTPALDSLFPMYWDDLTEEQKQDGVILNLTSAPITDGEYSVTVTPTGNWYAHGVDTVGENAGDPITITENAVGNMLQITFAASNTPEPGDDDMLVDVTVKINM